MEDYFPERGRVYSEPVILYVLTRDEHAQMLKSWFDRQITEFEDLARREQELLDENERLERLSGDELQKEENEKRLETQTSEEAETKRRMDELTRQMEELMKGATRNGDIDKETLQKMAESLKSMQELSEEDIPKVEEKLSESQDQSNTPEKSEKDVDEAVEQQKKAVEKKVYAALVKGGFARTHGRHRHHIRHAPHVVARQPWLTVQAIDLQPRLHSDPRQGAIDRARRVDFDNANVAAPRDRV